MSKEIEQKLENFLKIYVEAIQVVKKYIEKFKGIDINQKQEVLEGLEHGLNDLQSEYDLYKKKGAIRLERRLISGLLN